MSTQPSAITETTQEALDTIEDTLGTANSLLAAAAESEADGTVTGLRRHANSIKDVAGSAGIGILKVLAHRFEDYLSGISGFDAAARADCQVFLDRIAEAMDGRLDDDPQKIAEFCRRLPAKQAFRVEDVEIQDVEVMLVMTDGAATSFVTRELAECGYRIVNVWSTIDAFALAPQMRPDLIIVSNVMPELSGVDFACAIRAMPATHRIPVAVLTSQSRGDAALEDLPPDIPLLSKSARFADDVADVFGRYGLL